VAWRYEYSCSPQTVSRRHRRRCRAFIPIEIRFLTQTPRSLFTHARVVIVVACRWPFFSLVYIESNLSPGHHLTPERRRFAFPSRPITLQISHGLRLCEPTVRLESNSEGRSASPVLARHQPATGLAIVGADEDIGTRRITAPGAYLSRSAVRTRCGLLGSETAE
jgi:hypothetical protein